MYIKKYINLQICILRIANTSLRQNLNIIVNKSLQIISFMQLVFITVDNIHQMWPKESAIHSTYYERNY